MHPFVVGKLVLGHVSKGAEVLADLRNLSGAVVANEEEIIGFIIRRKLSGSGIGFVDVHLLAAAPLTPATLLRARDRRLREIARSSALAFPD